MSVVPLCMGAGRKPLISVEGKPVLSVFCPLFVVCLVFFIITEEGTCLSGRTDLVTYD